ncbi:MAG: hypothetical protein HOH04_15580 [Rhodospirillaceae bacterium]|jgi:hypothetical protein|nr:hypothetical protein [Rhodospirillaceae bacterium]
MAMNFFRSLILVSAGWALTACANTAPILSTPSNSTDQSAASTGAKVSAYSQFPDIPVPSGTKINMEKTLVFGNKPWYGQLALEASANANQMFDFYRENLSQYGWQEVTSVRAPTSILTYATDDRVLAIAIQGGTISGSNVTVTVSPRGQPQPQQSPGSLAPPSVQKLN